MNKLIENNQINFQSGIYEIQKLLGKGGMGEVYLVKNINVGSLWALKLISKHIASREIVLQELDIMRKLNHISLPRILDAGEDDDYIYLIVDYIEGQSLYKLIQTEGNVNEDLLINWAFRLCDVLHYLHTKKPNPIIYRDMKPSNIMIGHDGKVTLIDFGISREHVAGEKDKIPFTGSRHFAAPEQYIGLPTDARTDIYSLGATLYYALVREAPPEPLADEETMTYGQHLSKGMAMVIQNCMKNNPHLRYQNIDALKEGLRQVKRINNRSVSGLIKWIVEKI